MLKSENTITSHIPPTVCSHAELRRSFLGRVEKCGKTHYQSGDEIPSIELSESCPH
jgi:hypothetical protein